MMEWTWFYQEVGEELEMKVKVEEKEVEVLQELEVRPLKELVKLLCLLLQASRYNKVLLRSLRLVKNVLF